MYRWNVQFPEWMVQLNTPWPKRVFKIVMSGLAMFFLEKIQNHHRCPLSLGFLQSLVYHSVLKQRRLLNWGQNQLREDIQSCDHQHSANVLQHAPKTSVKLSLMVFQVNQFLAAESLTVSLKCTKLDSRNVLEEGLLSPLKTAHRQINLNSHPQMIFFKRPWLWVDRYSPELHSRIVSKKWLYCSEKVALLWLLIYFSIRPSYIAW